MTRRSTVLQVTGNSKSRRKKRLAVAETSAGPQNRRNRIHSGQELLDLMTGPGSFKIQNKAYIPYHRQQVFIDLKTGAGDFLGQQQSPVALRVAQKILDLRIKPEALNLRTNAGTCKPHEGSRML